MPNMDASARRHRLHQALHWQDLLWDSVLDEFAQRSPVPAQAVRETLAKQTVRALVGHSTRSAAAAWPQLDFQARADWIWVQKFIHRVWFRGMLAAERVSLQQEVAATPSKRAANVEEDAPALR